MPRTAREYSPTQDVIVHAYNWSVERKPVFPTNEEREEFVGLLLHVQECVPVSVLVYVILPDSFDLILHQHEPYAIGIFMKKVEEQFAVWFNRRTGRNGPVFSGRYRGEIIADEHGLLRVSLDIHLSPVVAGLVQNGPGWKHSSCNSYAGGCPGLLEDPSLIFALVGGPDQYANFMNLFDPAYPGSTEFYLCADHARIWGKRVGSAI